MALNRLRGLRNEGSFIVPDPTAANADPIKEGTLCLYDQVTETISLVDDDTYNAVTIGNGFGSDGKRVVEIATAQANREYWVRLGGTISKGDVLESDAEGRGVTTTGAGVFIAMSAGVIGQVVPVQMVLA
jgi:hypothetical protein